MVQVPIVCNWMELVCSPNNLWRAYKQLKQNKGVGGTDGMQVEEFALRWLSQANVILMAKCCCGSSPQWRVPNGLRHIIINLTPDIPTVIDRVIRQAISQVLSPIYEAEFSGSSYCNFFGRNGGAIE